LRLIGPEEMAKLAAEKEEAMNGTSAECRALEEKEIWGVTTRAVLTSRGLSAGLSVINITQKVRPERQTG
jgi:hypothetical protein